MLDAHNIRELVLGGQASIAQVGSVPVILEHHEGEARVRSLERLLVDPVRPRGSTMTGTWRDFTTLVAGLHSARVQRIYYDGQGAMRCVLNDDTSSGGGWKDWTADYRPIADEAWEAWRNVDGKWLDQLTMAEFIEDRLPDFREPSGGDMLDLAQRFEVYRGGSFLSGVRLDNGTTQLTVEETTTGRGNIIIPGTVSLGFRVFEDLDAYAVKAYFRYRIRENKLAMSFKIMERQKLVRTAVDDLVARVKSVLDLAYIKVHALPGAAPSLGHE